MTILVTGGAGYLGTFLVEQLLEKGYKVRIFDSFLFGEKPIEEFRDNPNLEVVKGDIRHIEELSAAMTGATDIIHLAGIVGDPACAINEAETLTVNVEATKVLVELCKYHKIKRVVFASTCSVYGASDNQILNEGSKLNPVSLYARTKIDGEKILLKAADDNFSPVILRFCTIMGVSRRMRFDLAINIMTAKAVNEGKVKIFGGTQWRPFISARDAARAFVYAFEAPLDLVKNEIFNVGANDMNFQFSNLKPFFMEAFPDVEIEELKEIEDKRSYRVSFDKIRNLLGYEPKDNIVSCIREIRVLPDSVLQDYTNNVYYNNKYLYK